MWERESVWSWGGRGGVAWSYLPSPGDTRAPPPTGDAPRTPELPPPSLAATAAATATVFAGGDDDLALLSFPSDAASRSRPREEGRGAAPPPPPPPPTPTPPPPPPPPPPPTPTPTPTPAPLAAPVPKGTGSRPRMGEPGRPPPPGKYGLAAEEGDPGRWVEPPPATDPVPVPGLLLTLPTPTSRRTSCTHKGKHTQGTVRQA